MICDFLLWHSKLLFDSFYQITGQKLLPGNYTEEELAINLYHAPFVLLSHGTQPDPIFNYANETAQKLWKLNREAFTRLPSRLSAEPIAVAERQAMLEEARQKGFISNYHGVRISSTGQRFMIKDAILWNMHDNSGTYRGQAATFKGWQYL